MILAVDPGATTGWAYFHPTGKLSCAGYEKHKLFLGYCFDDEDLELVVEIPRVYPYGGKGDPNDLIDLAVKAGEIRGRFSWQRSIEAHPATWKGSVPKDVHHRRVLAALSAEEVALLPKTPRSKKYDHNMLDAVGLGLWHLGRLRR